MNDVLVYLWFIWLVVMVIGVVWWAYEKVTSLWKE